MSEGGSRLDTIKYYQILLDAWKHQDETYWNAMTTFLTSESILFGAAGVAATIGDSIFVLPLVIALAIGGILIAILWLGVAQRLTDALNLTSHQCRHMELEIFDERLKKQDTSENARETFPMFFWGSYGIMRETLPCLTQDGDISQTLRKRLELHRNHQTTLDPSIIGRKFSAYRRMSEYLPKAFIAAWISIVVAALIYLALLAYQ